MFARTLLPILMFNLIMMVLVVVIVDIRYKPYFESMLPEQLSLLLLPRDSQQWFTIRPAVICSKGSPFLLTVVHSAVKNCHKRNVIRSTWADHRYNAYKEEHRVIFVVGRSYDADAEKRLKLEAGEYNDILQGDFVDTYYNLTIKGIVWMHWIVNYCPQPDFVLKTDDDAFVNVFGLKHYLRSIAVNASVAAKTANSGPMGSSTVAPKPWYGSRIFCKLWYNAGVERRIWNKWRVSRKEFGSEIYPRYCAGIWYFMQPEVVAAIYEEALKTELFWIDDVFFTGLLPHKLNITHTDIDPFTEYQPGNMKNALKKKDFLLGNVSNRSDVLVLWSMLLQEVAASRATNCSAM